MSKNTSRRKAVGPKSGQVMKAPGFGRTQGAAFIAAYVERKAKDYLLKKTQEEALRFTRKIAGTARKVADKDGREYEMIPNTFEGATASGPGMLPSETTKSVKRGSGTNGTYNSKVHKLKVVAGDPPSRAMARLMKDNGTLNKRILKTITDVKDDATRQQLTHAHGFNQKNIMFIHPGYFGYQYNGIWNTVLDYTTPTTPNDKIQRAYAAVSKLVSRVIITNNNAILPINVTFRLIRQKAIGLRALDLANEVINDSHTTQQAGKMPIHYQVRDIQTSTNMTFTAVDASSRSAMHGCMQGLSAYEIVKSQTVKLSAGDHAEFTYEHNYKSGIDLSKLLSAIIGNDPEDNSFFTYGLVIETWGPKVEALKLDASANPITPAVRMNGTGPGNYSFEFEKYAIGAKASSVYAPDTTETGIQVGPFATRVFTPEVLTGSETTKVYEYNYGLLNAPNGFKIPLITDTVVSQADRKL
jgi:hypothetical protein